MRCGRQEITIVAEKVRVSLPLMAESKGKKVLDVDIYARESDGAAPHERHRHGTERQSLTICTPRHSVELAPALTRQRRHQQRQPSSMIAGLGSHSSDMSTHVMSLTHLHSGLELQVCNMRRERNCIYCGTHVIIAMQPSQRFFPLLYLQSGTLPLRAVYTLQADNPSAMTLSRLKLNSQHTLAQVAPHRKISTSPALPATDS